MEEYDTWVYFDDGHWYKMGNDGPYFIRKFGHCATILHCQDVMDGKDHNTLLARLSIPWPLIMEALHRIGFDGVLVLEVKLPEDIETSLPVMKELGACRTYSSDCCVKGKLCPTGP